MVAFRLKPVWMIGEAVPLTVAIATALGYGVYSGWRELAYNPEVKVKKSSRLDQEIGHNSEWEKGPKVKNLKDKDLKLLCFSHTPFHKSYVHLEPIRDASK